jgi:4Fe-4S ferredoxin
LRKYETEKEIRIERRDLASYYSITLNKEQCNGCGICAEICPKEAIREAPAIIEKGILVKKPAIAFDVDKCVMCGECVVLCPLNALVMRIDEKEISTIVKNEAFPSLLRGIEVAKEKVVEYDYDYSNDSLSKTEYTQLSECRPECGMICEKECPVDAIQVSVQRSEDNQIGKIVDVTIDESKCIYCKHCELVCPFSAIEVRKPFHGILELMATLCPKDCTACQDICPTQAIKREDDKLVVNPQFCVFCSACQKICPEKAIVIQRDHIFHTKITAAAWLTALKKLVTYEGFFKEVMVDAGQRRVNVVKKRRKHIL